MRRLVPSNPVSVVDKPRQPPTKRPQPLAPLTVETICAGMSLRDATLTSLLAYGGLRPDEAVRGGYVTAAGGMKWQPRTGKSGLPASRA